MFAYDNRYGFRDIDCLITDARNDDPRYALFHMFNAIFIRYRHVAIFSAFVDDHDREIMSVLLEFVSR